LSSGVILALSRATTLAVVVYYRPLCAELANFRHPVSSLKINSVWPELFQKKIEESLIEDVVARIGTGRQINHRSYNGNDYLLINVKTM